MSTLRITLALVALLVLVSTSAQAAGPMASNAPTGFAKRAVQHEVTLQTESPSGCTTIPDDAYNGSLGSMLCGNFTVSNSTGVVTDVNIDVAVDHTWVGDLVYKLVAPGGLTATLMSRPGFSETVDDGSGGAGNNADLQSSAPIIFDDQSGGPSAENMGSSGSVVCAGDGICSYVSSPGGTSFGGLSAFNGLSSGNGTWQICVGDAGASDVGSLCDANLAITAGGGGGSGLSANIVNAGASTDCIATYITFTLESNGGNNGGAIDVVVFDDNQQEYQQRIIIPAGFGSQTISFSYDDPNIGTGAPGLGLLLFDLQGNELDRLDPLFVNEETNCGVSSPVVTLSLNPNPVPAGQPFTISWSSTNATGFTPCISALGNPTGWSQTQFRSAQGTETYTVNTPGVVDFAMECASETGLRGDAAIRLTVSQPSSVPIVDLNATPPRLGPNGAVILKWNSNISSGGLPCTPTGGAGTAWARAGAQPASGRFVVAAPMTTGPVNFGLQCSTGGQSGTDVASVTVVAINNPPPPPRPIASSVTSDGTPVTGTSKRASISRDGSALTFETTAANVSAILPGTGATHTDTNGQMDIFLKLAGNPNAVLCSIDENGPLTVGTMNAKLAPDGAGATFESTDGQIRTFEGGLGRTRGLTSSSSTGVAGNAASANPSINAGATMVAFDSAATNLVPNDGNGSTDDVFIKVPQTGEIALVSQGIGGAPANGQSTNPAVSADGSTVFFQTRATNIDGFPAAAAKALAKGGGTSQICGVRNPAGVGRSTGCVSISTVNGMPGNGDSRNVRMSDNGDFGVFESEASNLVEGDSNGVTDVFWFNWNGSQVTGLVRVSTSKDGVQGNGPSTNPTISGDGLTVVFQSAASNLDPPDANGQSDAFLKYVQSGQIIRMDGTANGQEPNGGTANPVISGDGTTVAFGSDANNIVPNDTNNSTDVFSVPAPQVLDADEPGLIQALLPAPVPPNPFCPAGFFGAIVDDGPAPGVSTGIFGLELLLDDPGTRQLEGGLNFGGLIDVSQVGFAGANMTNPAGEPQVLNISLTGSPANNPAGSLPVRVKVERATSEVRETVFERVTTLTLATPFVDSVVVTPGYYVATVATEGAPASAAGGPAEGQFFFSLTTNFVDRLGGGFQGGAVVGGYHADNPSGGVSGFASFCIATEHTVTVRTFAQPTYGPTGATDLQLLLNDVNQELIYAVPGN